MTTSHTTPSVSRRAAIVGLGAGALGLAVATRHPDAVAQDATPTTLSEHPMVGTWVVDRDTTTAADAPSVVVYTADGGLLDPSQGVAGAWQATGPQSAAWTLVVFIQQGAGGYVAIRSNGEVDAGGNTLDSPYSFTVVAPDGTVVASGQGTSRYTRLQIEPIEAGGSPLAGFPTWTPPPPADATPTA